MKYRKKPVEIEAVQYDGWERVDGLPLPMFEGSFDLIPDWLMDAQGKKESEPGAVFVDEGVLTIVTLKGNHRADPGDYIIQGVKGELYPCKPEIFEATYDVVPG